MSVLLFFSKPLIISLSLTHLIAAPEGTDDPTTDMKSMEVAYKNIETQLEHDGIKFTLKNGEEVILIVEGAFRWLCARLQYLHC